MGKKVKISNFERTLDLANEVINEMNIGRDHKIKGIDESDLYLFLIHRYIQPQGIFKEKEGEEYNLLKTLGVTSAKIYIEHDHYLIHFN